MLDWLNHSIDLMAHGLLTELPTQLVTAAIVAAGSAMLQAWRRRHPHKDEDREV
ncbi:hypothetical protein ABT143_17060 [Streptomyces sp. NPDC002033]|uniref:hypothetical protein n=1 Tax=unclassified Streptomyces TaxID=2593676 RepID=UPI00332041DD